MFYVRIEACNSAIKTLHSMLVNSISNTSSYLSKQSLTNKYDVYYELLMQLILPLLSDLLIDSETIKDTTDHHKKEITLAIHYTRDTLEKWNETRMLAIEGIARVLKAYIKYILSNLTIKIDNLIEIWNLYLQIMKSILSKNLLKLIP